MVRNRDPLTTNVVACCWKRGPAGWTLWVKGRPEVCGTGQTYEEAEERLITAIWHAAPDLDAVEAAVPEYDPPIPAPASAEQYVKPELYLIRGDGLFEVYRPTRDREASEPDRERYFNSLFTNGLCSECRGARGARTGVPLRVGYVPRHVDGGWVRSPISTTIYLFSDRFVDLLQPTERDRIGLRPIGMPQRARRRFFELVGPAVAKFVHPTELEADGCECSLCGWRTFHSSDPRWAEEGLRVEVFLCLEDLPEPLPDLFVVGLGSQVQLCATRQRWDRIRAARGARGILGQRVGVVRRAESVAHPRLRQRGATCDTCSGWPEPRALDDRRQAVFEWPARMCSSRNFPWVRKAEAAGCLHISRATVDLEQIAELVSREQPPPKTEFLSFRCPTCWRLGWIILTRREVQLRW